MSAANNFTPINHQRNAQPKRSKRGSTWRRWSQAALRATFPLAAGLFAWPLAAHAADNWQFNNPGFPLIPTANGNWSDGAHWSSGSPPALNDTANLSLGSGTGFTNFTVTFDVDNVGGSYTALNVEMTGTQIGHQAVLNVTANHLNALTENVGNSTAISPTASRGNGLINLSGGTNSVVTLVLGVNATDVGNYSLSGTGVLASTSEYIGSSPSVAAAARGSFTQTGGSNTAPTLVLADQTGSQGFYTLSGGSLLSSTQQIGAAGAGSFNQSNSTNTINTELDLGLSFGSSGNYSLSSGSLAAPTENIGNAAAGSFFQSGGINTIAPNNSGILRVGYSNGSTGLYSLSGAGTLVSQNEYIGYSIGSAGAFNQSGGSNATSYLSVGGLTPGSYLLSAGNLSSQNEDIELAGSFTHVGGTNTVSNLLRVGIFSGTTPVTYSLGSGAALSTPTEDLGYSGPASFIQSGGSHNANNLTIGLGAAASYTMSAGSLSTSVAQLGYTNAATFTQSGGTHTNTGELDLGYSAAGTGSYVLSNPGSAVNAASEYIGVSGSGTFTQNDGINTLTAPFFNFFVALNANSSGAYLLNGGTLQDAGLSPEFAFEAVGYSGNGSFIQTGGANSLASTGSLNLGLNAGSTGTYSLSGTGLVTVGTEKIGISGSATFLQSAGANFPAQLNIGLPTSIAGAHGTYSLSGTGYLSSSGENIGQGGNATFIQSGGNHVVNGTMFVGHNGGTGTGLYSLSGTGSLLVTASELIGTSGPGSFIQSGGTNTLLGSSTLDIFGSGDGSTVYSLTGGAINAGSGGVAVQSAVFSINGTGTLTTTGSLFLSGAAGTAVNLLAGAVTVATLNSNGISFAQTGGSLAITSTLAQSAGAISLGGPQTLYTIPTIAITGGTTTLTTDAKKLIVTNSISFFDGALNLTKNSLLLHSTAPNLTTDFNGLYDDMGATQIYSSSVTGGGGTTLGLLKAADYLALNAPGTLFAGQTVTSTDILIKFTYTGDANLDGKITADDYAQLDAGFLLQPPNPAWVNGDYNFDGQITYLDYAAIDAGLLAYQTAGSPLAQLEISQHAAEFGAPYLAALQQDTTPSPIPEPATLSFFALIALPLLSRRPKP